MDIKTAQNLAVDICYKLQPFTEKLNIAGSIRRQKAEVKDIEIVCLPHSEEKKDLFGNVHGLVRSFHFINAVRSLGQIIKGDPGGRMMQIELPENIILDLFMPQSDDYYRQYAIRTGSADYAGKVIASAWVKNGWAGTSDGLRRQSDCVKKGEQWICLVKNPMRPKVWQDEEDFFNWIGVKWVHPKLREVQNPAFNQFLSK